MNSFGFEDNYLFENIERDEMDIINFSSAFIKREEEFEYSNIFNSNNNNNHDNYYSSSINLNNERHYNTRSIRVSKTPSSSYSTSPPITQKSKALKTTNDQSPQYFQQQEQQPKLKIEKPTSTPNKITDNVDVSSTAPLDIVVTLQPPSEIRTRTPNEMRIFSIGAQCVGKFKEQGAAIVNVILRYSNSSQKPGDIIEKDILGGTKTLPILQDGTVNFTNLSICESSTKHKEREFCVEFILLRKDGKELMRKHTQSFYAFSHKKVLERRGNVKIRLRD